MNSNKKTQLIHKRHAELSKQIYDLKFQLVFDKQHNTKGYEKAKDLIFELESIKSEWLLTIQKLHNQKAEYQLLLDDMHSIRTIMSGMDFKVPWYNKLFRRKQHYSG